MDGEHVQLGLQVLGHTAGTHRGHGPLIDYCNCDRLISQPLPHHPGNTSVLAVGHLLVDKRPAAWTNRQTDSNKWSQELVTVTSYC